MLDEHHLVRVVARRSLLDPLEEQGIAVTNRMRTTIHRIAACEADELTRRIQLHRLHTADLDSGCRMACPGVVSESAARDGIRWEERDDLGALLGARLDAMHRIRLAGALKDDLMMRS